MIYFKLYGCCWYTLSYMAVDDILWAIWLLMIYFELYGCCWYTLSYMAVDDILGCFRWRVVWYWVGMPKDVYISGTRPVGNVRPPYKLTKKASTRWNIEVDDFTQHQGEYGCFQGVCYRHWLYRANRHWFEWQF